MDKVINEIYGVENLDNTHDKNIVVSGEIDADKIKIDGKLLVNNDRAITCSSLQATSTTNGNDKLPSNGGTGALIVNGGCSIEKELNVGNDVQVISTGTSATPAILGWNQTEIGSLNNNQNVTNFQCYIGPDGDSTQVSEIATNLQKTDSTIDGTSMSFSTYNASEADIVEAMKIDSDGIVSLKTTTGALNLNSLTTTQRNLLTAVSGMLIYNNTINQIENYNGSSWVSVNEDLTGYLHLSGGTMTGSLQVDEIKSSTIGPTSDPDLMELSSNLLTVNGVINATKITGLESTRGEVGLSVHDGLNSDYQIGMSADTGGEDRLKKYRCGLMVKSKDDNDFIPMIDIEAWDGGGGVEDHGNMRFYCKNSSSSTAVIEERMRLTFYGQEMNGYMNIVSGKNYRINSTEVLSNDTLGTGILASSLTSVGALASGSIASGFGSINCSDITCNGDLAVSGDFKVDTNDLFIDSSTNRVRIGVNAGNEYRLELGGGDAYAMMRMMSSNTSSSTSGAGMVMGSDDGSALGNGHRLGYQLFFGSENSSGDRANSAGIVAYATQNWSDGNNGTKLVFEACKLNSSTRTPILAVHGHGVGIDLGTSLNPINSLDIGGAVCIGSNLAGSQTLASNTLRVEASIRAGNEVNAQSYQIDGTEVIGNDLSVTCEDITVSGVINMNSSINLDGHLLLEANKNIFMDGTSSLSSTTLGNNIVNSSLTTVGDFLGIGGNAQTGVALHIKDNTTSQNQPIVYIQNSGASTGQDYDASLILEGTETGESNLYFINYKDSVHNAMTLIWGEDSRLLFRHDTDCDAGNGDHPVGNDLLIIDGGNDLVAMKRTIIGATTIEDSALLQLSSSDKGFIPPRMNTSQRTGITSPADGLMVYDNELNSIQYFNGSNWVGPGDSSSGNWTPTMSGHLGGNFTLSTAEGNYRRMGDTYFVSIKIIWTNKGSASGNVHISLPISVDYDQGLTISYIQNVTFTNQITSEIPGTGNYVRLTDMVSGGSSSVRDIADYGTTGTLVMSGMIV
jgi:hypothetical protein